MLSSDLGLGENICFFTFFYKWFSFIQTSLVWSGLISFIFLKSKPNQNKYFFSFFKIGFFVLVWYFQLFFFLFFFVGRFFSTPLMKTKPNINRDLNVDIEHLTFVIT